MPSPPSRGRGSKLGNEIDYAKTRLVASLAGAWIETSSAWRTPAANNGSPPSRGRGSKQADDPRRGVRSRQGRLPRGGVDRNDTIAIIIRQRSGRLPRGGVDRNDDGSTSHLNFTKSPPSRGRGSKPYGTNGYTWTAGVASLAGAWIETMLMAKAPSRGHVASLAGAWIETLSRREGNLRLTRRLPRGGVDRNTPTSAIDAASASPPSRGRGSKHSSDDARNASVRRLPRGGVDRNQREHGLTADGKGRLPRGGVDRNVSSEGRSAHASGRLPRGGVDRNYRNIEGETRIKAGRLPRGGVDRNNALLQKNAAARGRLPRGGVDRNTAPCLPPCSSARSPPSRGRGSKPSFVGCRWSREASPPSRGRGSKHKRDAPRGCRPMVASLAGAWIETFHRFMKWSL